MTPHAEGEFAGSEGRLYWQAWQPADAKGKAKALLIIVHGYAEHSGRYRHVADYFAAHGYAVYTFDQIGHGQSAGQRGHVVDFDHYIEDLKRFIALAQSKEPGLKTFLLGHSQGGLVVLRYGIVYPADVNGVVVTGAGLMLSMLVPAWKLALGKVLSNLVPTFSMSSDIPAQYLSHDPAVSGAYAAQDPLVHHVATARWASEFFAAQADTLAAAERFTLPYLLLHGGDDHIASVEGAKQFHAAAASRDKTLKFYDGYYHELYNELGKETVLADVDEWLEKHLTQGD